MYIKDLALNNLQWLICHKPNKSKYALRFGNCLHYTFIFIVFAYG